MDKVLTLTLRITVSDLPHDELERMATEAAADVDEFPSAADLEPCDLSSPIADLLTEQEVQQEYIWAGSGLYARIASVQIVSATFDAQENAHG